MDPNSKSRRFSGIKFLYVDDEAENLTSFRMNYDTEFQILTFTDPIQAFKAIENDPEIAVLLVDQVMAGMVGLELATKAKKLRPTMICVMITGNATKDLAVESVRSHVIWEFVEKPINFSSSAARQLFISAVQEHLLEKVKTDYRQGTIELIAQLIDDKDGHTFKHSSHVTEMALKIAAKFDLSEKEMLMIREGALLHDLGKISIPDDILKKPGRLSELERRIIMTHPGRGGDLLARVPQLRELAPIARYHHERPDGKGYPEGLKGDQIPLMSQIVALADFFEALSAKRPYKEPWAVTEIVKEIESVRGAQFTSAVIDALFAVLREEGLVDFDALNRARAAVG